MLNTTFDSYFSNSANFKQTDNLNKTTVQDQKLNKKSKLNQKPKLTADQKATNRIKREQKKLQHNQLYIIILLLKKLNWLIINNQNINNID